MKNKVRHVAQIIQDPSILHSAATSVRSSLAHLFTATLKTRYCSLKSSVRSTSSSKLKQLCITDTRLRSSSTFSKTRWIIRIKLISRSWYLLMTTLWKSNQWSAASYPEASARSHLRVATRNSSKIWLIFSSVRSRVMNHWFCLRLRWCNILLPTHAHLARATI